MYLLFFSDKVIRHSKLNLMTSQIYVSYKNLNNPLVFAINDMVKQDNDAVERLRQLPEAKSDPKISNMSFNDFKRKINPQGMFIDGVLNDLKKTPEGRDCLGVCKDMSDFQMSGMVFHENVYDLFDTQEEFENFEEWIIDTIGAFFERRIEVISIFDRQDRLIFHPHHEKCWYIFAIRANKESVYVSTSNSNE